MPGQKTHHRIEFPEQVDRLSARVDDATHERPIELLRRGFRELSLPDARFSAHQQGPFGPRPAARMARALSGSNWSYCSGRFPSLISSIDLPQSILGGGLNRESAFG